MEISEAFINIETKEEVERTPKALDNKGEYLET